MTAQKPLPSEVTVEVLQSSVVSVLKLLPSVADALAPLLSVVNAQKPQHCVVLPLRPPLSEVTAVVPHRLPTNVQPLAPLAHASHLAPPTDVPVPQDLIAHPAQAVLNMRQEVSRDVELHQLLLHEVAHRGPPEVVPEHQDLLADPSTSMAVE